MRLDVRCDQLINLSLSLANAEMLLQEVNHLLQPCQLPQEAWAALTDYLSQMNLPFAVHLFFLTQLFPNWQNHPDCVPVWQPSRDVIENANISHFMKSVNQSDVRSFHQWTSSHYQDFWPKIIDTLGIVFKKQPDQLVDVSQGLESPTWLPGAALNIVDSCFTAPGTAAAIIYRDANHQICHLSYDELNQLSNRVANSLVSKGIQQNDAVAIAMPMNVHAIAIYLGIIKMGGVVVSIADSFSSQEMSVRLKIANTKAVFTQDYTDWGSKKLPLYEKLVNANSPCTIVIPVQTAPSSALELLRSGDCSWDDFLSQETQFTTVACQAMSAINILFSSGTTGDPKAIAWNHTTPIKVGSDAYFHQNIKQGDRLAWPTNLGWMMGPWLIFAALLNKASIAIHSGAPKDRAFGEFIQDAKVTMLGVVPTLVATWRQTQCMEGLDWGDIKVFSSTGECSNAEDMFYLMTLANYKPVIEYCGGTEIGGAYLSSTVIQSNYPSLFSTPTMGLDICMMDEGEVAIIPPSIGLSTQLLNANHHQVYFDNMPKGPGGCLLRRHGDQIKRLPNGYYCILGRADDTMNLGGIKISAAEIERALAGLPHIIEVAAIAVSPAGNGPSQLVIYAATQSELDKTATLQAMQQRISQQLNPLFKIHDIRFVKELPKTASNKIMRRMLRKNDGCVKLSS